jgi:ubiquinone biosynthesis protein
MADTNISKAQLESSGRCIRRQGVDGTVMTKGHRYREILTVLTRRGVGVVDDELIKHEAGDRARAEQLRRALEELGTTFIKLGQVLSTRSDLLSEVYRAELVKLQDNVPALPKDIIAEVIREDLGSTPDKIFSLFDQVPLASASIAQVHAARLFDGRDVVVKVRKPGVAELVRSILKFWQTSSMDGLGAFQSSTNTTPVVSSQRLATH